MKRLPSLLLLLMTIVVLSGTFAMAANDEIFPITITDNSSTDRTNFPVLLSFNGTSLVDAGFVAANATDTNMQLGPTSVPFLMGTTQVPIFVENLPSDEQITYKLLTGYSPEQSAFEVIVGEGGYITVSDHADLELGDNFTIVQSGYVDTTVVGANLTSKDSAFRTYISASGNITSEIVGSVAVNATGISSGNMTITTVAGTTDNGTMGNESIEASSSDLDSVIRGANFTATETLYVTSMSIYMTSLGGPGRVATGAIYDSDLSLQGQTEEISVAGATQWNTANFTHPVLIESGEDYWLCAWAAPQSGLEDIEYYFGAGNTNQHLTQGLTYTGTYPNTLVPTGYSDFTMSIYTSANNDPTLMIFVNGGAAKDSVALGGASVTDNGNDWLLMQGDAMGYMSSFQSTVDGTLVAHYEPNQMITTTTLPDRAGTAQDGTITWGSNTDILFSYGEVDEDADVALTPDAATIGFDAPALEMPDEWYATTSKIGNLPFYTTLNQVSTDTGIPLHTIYIGILVSIALAFGVFFAVAFKSAIPAVIIIGGILIMGADATIIPIWAIFTFLVATAGILYAARAAN